ncbi:hypothetical protein [Natrinema sp. J7-1]|nr:hypothetical protein [Natrinema sp. J7-1]
MSEALFHRNQKFVEFLAAAVVIANFEADVKLDTPVGNVSIGGGDALSSD